MILIQHAQEFEECFVSVLSQPKNLQLRVTPYWATADRRCNVRHAVPWPIGVAGISGSYSRFTSAACHQPHLCRVLFRR